MEYELVIIGAGPIGLAAAIDAKRNGINYVVLEKGILVNSIFNFPTYMHFFTEANLLEIGGYPFPSSARKPSREQALDYYRTVAQAEDLNIKFNHEVSSINLGFIVKGIHTLRGNKTAFQFKTRYIIIATGYYDNPVGLGGIPGEKLDHVSYYYDEPHQYYGKLVVVIGAGNSGAEAALDLYRHGAKVTLIHKHSAPKSALKYWISPDLRNRIKEGSIDAIMPAETIEITQKSVIVERDGEIIEIPCDRVFILTGFTPDMKLLKSWGLAYDKETLACELSEEYESSVTGIFIIGSAGMGRATNTVFIENGRQHATIAVKAIIQRFNT